MSFVVLIVVYVVMAVVVPSFVYISSELKGNPFGPKFDAAELLGIGLFWPLFVLFVLFLYFNEAIIAVLKARQKAKQQSQEQAQ